MALTQITLTGTLEDAFGSPASGYVEFRPGAPMIDDDGDKNIHAGKVRAPLVNGSFTAVLYATDQPGVEPSGNFYWVQEMIDGVKPPPKPYRIILPYDAPDGEIRLDDIAPAQGVGGVSYGVTAGQFAAHTGDTTDVHGIPNTANLATTSQVAAAVDGLVEDDDVRLTNTRTPTDGSVTNAKVATDADIALSKLADITTARILGRVTADAGDIEQLTATQVAAFIDAELSESYAPLDGSSENYAEPMPPKAVGTWAKPEGTYQATIIGWNDRVSYHPVLLDREVNIDRLAIEVTTGVASAVARLGIYADDGSTSPGARLFDGGSTLDCSTTGVKELTVSTTLPRGLIWLAIGVTGGASAPSFKGSNPPAQLVSSVAAVTQMSDAHGVLSNSSTYTGGGALASTALVSNSRTSRIPLVAWRVAA